MVAGTASGEVTAAWIAAGAAIVAALASVTVAVWSERKRRQAESVLAAERRDLDLVLAALGYFQGSQNRSVGIAALSVLSGRRGWNEYRGAVSQLFYRQLLYLFAHAGNRWQAHEVSNIGGMTDWLLNGDIPVTPEMKRHLRAAMSRYENAWERVSDEVREKADTEAVADLIVQIKEWRKSIPE
jgi:hypothetical protein